MSINPLGASLATRMVHPSTASPASQEETQKVSPQAPDPLVGSSGGSEDQSTRHHEEYSCSNEMSTQDFLLMRTQDAEDPYEVLDKVIARMKQSMEELGDVLETMSEMAESTSKSKLALQLLEKTFGAIDEMRGDK